MRTLLLLILCGLCATLAVMECRDRKNRRSLVVHAGIGVFIGWVIFRLIVHTGIFERG
ncbi:MAG: hypothetical protein JNL39_12615 [Opitutaceae bacterium]|nr:hypothetical protein [Opitutaceae bacterium]